MKRGFFKRILAITSAAVLLAAATPVMASEPEQGGTILWLSNITSGVQYDVTVSYLTALCEELGYQFKVVYGDTFNDAAGNLQAVKNGMTDDVVGLLVSQDGGVQAIMEEYPDLYVAGMYSDMDSVFREDGENSACLENDHFLGTISDGYISGYDNAQSYFDRVVDLGYKKIAFVDFPAFAYPNLATTYPRFVELIEEYNSTASEEDQIQLIGEETTLMFTPLEDSWFLEEGHSDLDAIIAVCAGTMFVFPTLSTAIANGICSPTTKLVTGGFDTDPAIVDYIGDSEGKIITSVTFSPMEDAAYSLVLLDNAITGNQYEDFAVERIDPIEYTIDSDADIENVMTKSMVGTNDVSKAQIPIEMVINELCKRNNPSATFEQLKETFHNQDLLSVDSLANR